jgi:hypothetical protein
MSKPIFSLGTASPSLLALLLAALPLGAAAEQGDAAEEDHEQHNDDGRVRLAFVWVGSRKAATPLDTASTSVMAVQPLEKTLASSQS